jgi:hypothetical protein
MITASKKFTRYAAVIRLSNKVLSSRCKTKRCIKKVITRLMKRVEENFFRSDMDFIILIVNVFDLFKHTVKGDGYPE